MDSSPDPTKLSSPHGGDTINSPSYPRLRDVHDALTEAGFEPLVTGDPEELSTVIRERNPHLVLLDLMLPGSDGIELMETLPDLADLPVIFISGYGRDETIARALKAAAAWPWPGAR